MTIDFIGDIHGHADVLKHLLSDLGYHKRNQRWTHRQATLVFLGDLVDRGPEQRETVELVRELCASNLALCLSGNHEFNAVGFATERTDAPGQYVRSHTDNHIRQHEAFLEAYANDRSGYEETLAWFRRLPLWFEAANVRAIHACWHGPSQNALKHLLDAAHCPIDHTFFTESGTPGSDAWQAREVLLNGMEAKLPNEVAFTDYYGITRRRIRVNWWSPGQTTFRQAAVIDDTQRHVIPDMPMEEASPEYTGTLCFFGHYWMRGTPRIQHPRAVCLDYSIALPDGALCAYRFDGEQTALPEHLTWRGH